jgi:hypothetical protein
MSPEVKIILLHGLMLAVIYLFFRPAIKRHEEEREEHLALRRAGIAVRQAKLDAKAKKELPPGEHSRQYFQYILDNKGVLPGPEWRPKP